MKNKNHSHIRAALYGQPWAITQQGFDLICGIFESHVAGHESEFFTSAMKKSNDPGDGENLDFDFINGVAVIPIQGPIFPKANLFTRISGATSLDDLGSKLDAAISLEPSAVVFNIDSPGGAVSGLYDFCNKLFAARQSGICDIVAMCNPTCASAAYMIASQCGAVYATEGSIVGSIGVLARIDNYDRAERNEGNDPITLTSSELKMPGTGTLNQMGDMQRMVSGYFDQFKATVQRGRPGMDVATAATGQTWLGKSHNADKSAKDMGLIDGITTMDELLDEYGRPVPAR